MICLLPAYRALGRLACPSRGCFPPNTKWRQQAHYHEWLIVTQKQFRSDVRKHFVIDIMGEKKSRTRGVQLFATAGSSCPTVALACRSHKASRALQNWWHVNTRYLDSPEWFVLKEIQTSNTSVHVCWHSDNTCCVSYLLDQRCWAHFHRSVGAGYSLWPTQLCSCFVFVHHPFFVGDCFKGQSNRA